MIMPGALANHRRLFSTALASSAVAAVVLIASALPDRIGAGSRSAAAATATALAPAQVRVTRRREIPPPVVHPIAERSGILLYFLMEAARPQGIFGR